MFDNNDGEFLWGKIIANLSYFEVLCIKAKNSFITQQTRDKRKYYVSLFYVLPNYYKYYIIQITSYK